MTNWLGTMQQTFEYYIVDPGTWKDDHQSHPCEAGPAEAYEV